jgi:hypothetical protein
MVAVRIAITSPHNATRAAITSTGSQGCNRW